MCRLIICACHTSATERFLFGIPELGTRLLSHVLRQAEKIHPTCISAITLPDRKELFNKFGIKSTIVEKPLRNPLGNVETLQALMTSVLSPVPEDEQTETIVVVAPGLGPVTHTRMQETLNASRTSPETHLFISIIPVPINCNPAWLHAIPTVDARARQTQVDAHAEIQGKIKICRADGTNVLKGGQPLGSQWLPQLWYFDGAVACIHPKVLNNEPFRTRYVLACNKGKQPLLYELPIFQFGEEQDINWSLSSGDVAALFEYNGQA